MMEHRPNPWFLAGVLRLALLIYGEWQDATMDVKYTDVDYWVFNDAAAAIHRGGSPFDRATYRYTPLLAYLLLPNVHLMACWGKLLFCAADLVAAYFIQQILVRNLRVEPSRANWIVCISWLFNPMIFTISTRGNAESLLCSLILGSLYFQMEGNLMFSGLLFGLSVHLKLFPAIYSVAFLPFIWYEGWKVPLAKELTEKPSRHPLDILRRSPSVDSLASFDSDAPSYRSRRRKKHGSSKTKRKGLKIRSMSRKLWLLVQFAFWSLASFGATTIPMLLKYGDAYLQESFLYHLTRKDHRHNFSPYFFPFYLESVKVLPRYTNLVAFIPQLMLLVCIGLKYGRKFLPVACFLQTFVFVTLNKVCTSQYFLWYLCQLPFVYASLPSVKLAEWVGLISCWFGAQGIWLKFAYDLEFVGRQRFVHVWAASIGFLLVNTYIAAFIIRRINVK